MFCAGVITLSSQHLRHRTHPKQSRHEPAIQLIPVLGTHVRVQSYLQLAGILTRIAPSNLPAKTSKQRLGFIAACK